MYLRLVLTIALVASVSCKDVEQGQNATEARKIFDEKREASPAVWRQVDKVTVNTTDAEVISRVVVTDLRPDKDGEANIVEGGEGNQTVTIELKSPTVLRGYEFHIEVYAVPDNGHEVSTPDLTGSDKHKLSNPAIVGNEDQSKPREDDLRLKINEFKPPSNFGADSTTKPPVPLSTDLKVNDEKRITRDTEEKKIETAENHHSVNGKKTTPDSEEKKLGATENHPITFVNPTDPLKIIPGRTDKPQKDIEVSTHLPTTAGDAKQKDEHARHVRDTAKQTSTTQAPSTTKAVKDLKDDFPEMIYPQSHIDKMGNTDKMLFPVEPITHDTKDVAEKDGHSTTTSTSTTVKPRAVRDTGVTTPKTEVKDKTQDDKYIQKIPADGHVTIPKEWTDFQNKNGTKSGVDNSKDNQGPPPAPLFPSFNQESAKHGPSFNQGSAKNGPGFNQDSAKGGPSLNQDSAKNGPGFNQDSAKNGPGFNQDSAKNVPSFTQDSAKPTPSKPKVGPSSSDESDSSEEDKDKKPVKLF